MSDTINIEDFVDAAIIEGFRNGVQSFQESLEAELQNQAVIEESGDANTLLQAMIDAQVENNSAQNINENMETLGNKMNFLFNN